MARLQNIETTPPEEYTMSKTHRENSWSNKKRVQSSKLAERNSYITQFFPLELVQLENQKMNTMILKAEKPFTPERKK